MVEERAQVEQEVRRVNEAGETLDQIGQSLAQSAELVTNISHTASSQRAGAHTIVQGMQQVTSVADTIRDHAEQVRETTMALAAAARDLDDSIAPLYGCASTPATAAPQQHAKTQSAGREILRDLAMEVLQ